MYQIFYNDCLCRTSLEDSLTLYDKPAALLNYVPFTKYSLHYNISHDVTDVCFGIGHGFGKGKVSA